MKHAANTVILSLLVLGLIQAAGCGGGGGGGFPIPPVTPVTTVVLEVEPNDDVASALLLVLGSAGKGSVIAAGDLDFWSFSALAGQLFRIELYATRHDQLTWDANVNAPRFTLIAPDGTFLIYDHDFSGTDVAGWAFSAQDLDFPRFQADLSGTYSVLVTQDDPTRGGGEYVIRIVGEVLPTLQFEAEIPGTTGFNDSVATAEPIAFADLRGFHVDGEVDYYAILVSGPTIIDVEIVTYRNGGHEGDDSYYSPRLDLFFLDGVTLLATNDATFYSDSTIRYMVTLPGVYFIRVGQSAGSGDGDYYLSLAESTVVGFDVEVEPNDDPTVANLVPFGAIISGSTAIGDDDWYAIDGLAGDMIQVFQYDLANRQDATGLVTVDFIAPDGVTLLGQDSFGTLGVTRTILQEDGVHFVRVRTIGPATPYTVQFRLFLESEYEIEPNETPLTANSIDLLGLGAGVIDIAGDVDFFSFSAVEDEFLIISVFAAPSPGSDGFASLSGYGSLMLPRVRILDPVGALIAEATSQPIAGVFAEGITDGLPTLATSITTTLTGEYFIEITDALGDFSIDHYYMVEVR